MKKTNAVFRVDASSRIGTGHVIRCLTLADALAKAGWNCRFLCETETLETVPALARSGYPVSPPEEAEGSADWLIVDHYGLDRAYEDFCRDWANRILVIDDLANRVHECDLLMDQTFGRDSTDYKGLVPLHARVLTGAQYALLRPQFADVREGTLTDRQERGGALQSILVMMGATDEHNVTGQVLEDLNLCQLDLHVDVIMGAAAPHLEAVRAQAEEAENVTVHTDVIDMAAFMARADLAIGAGGTTSWERCCLGLPTLLIEIADNQRLVAQKLHEAGAVHNLGWFKDITSQNIAEQVERLRDHPDVLAEMSGQAAEICDGQGAMRLMEAMTGV